MSHELLREEYIENGANPEDVDDALSVAEFNNLSPAETRIELNRRTGLNL